MKNSGPFSFKENGPEPGGSSGRLDFLIMAQNVKPQRRCQPGRKVTFGVYPRRQRIDSDAFDRCYLAKSQPEFVFQTDRSAMAVERQGPLLGSGAHSFFFPSNWRLARSRLTAIARLSDAVWPKRAAFASPCWRRALRARSLRSLERETTLLIAGT